MYRFRDGDYITFTRRPAVVTLDGADLVSEEKIIVEVAYATPQRQEIVELNVDEGTSLIEAVRLSRITDHFPEIDLDRDEMGVFGRKVDKHTRLKNLDRVEIYRPLLVDPKEARRRRAARAKARRSS